MNCVYFTLMIFIINKIVNSSISPIDCSKQKGMTYKWSHFLDWTLVIITLFSDIVEDFEIELKYCGCKRKISKQFMNQNSAQKVLFNDTTCSLDAYNRGMGQKIIGYSLFGDYTSDRL